MELEELKQGLKDIQGDSQPETPQPWLGMDNLMGSYGSWFGNDKGLGELLLGQLRSRGVDTQAATEAMLREILTGLVDDLNLLQQRLTGFTQAVAQQVQEVNAVKDSVDSAIAQAGGTPASLDVGEPVAGGVGEAPVEEPVAPAGEVSAEGAPAPEEPVPAAEPPAEAPAEEMPPAEEASAEEPPAEEEVPDETLSDKRTKKIKGYCLSDAGMKKVVAALSKPKGFSFSPEMVAAARRF